MPDFMLFLHQDLGTGPIRSPEEMMAVTKEYMAWAERMRAEGRLKGGERLANDPGKVLRPKGGRIAVLDLLAHQFEEARELYADRWLGFSEADLREWLATAGLHEIEVQLLTPESSPPHFQPTLASGIAA